MRDIVRGSSTPSSPISRSWCFTEQSPPTLPEKPLKALKEQHWFIIFSPSAIAWLAPPSSTTPEKMSEARWNAKPCDGIRGPTLSKFVPCRTSRRYSFSFVSAKPSRCVVGVEQRKPGFCAQNLFRGTTRLISNGTKSKPHRARSSVIRGFGINGIASTCSLICGWNFLQAFRFESQRSRTHSIRSTWRITVNSKPFVTSSTEHTD